MTLRDDIRHHFEDEARRLPAPPGLRSSVVGEAARGAVIERRTTQWAAAVAALLAVAVIAGLVASGSLLHPRSTPVAPGPVVSPTPAQPETSPTPSGGAKRVLLDATTYDGSTGWALLKLCTFTPDGTCQFSVSKTADGGKHWRSVNVGPAYPSTNGDVPQHIHFADASNGFVYGHSAGFVTHDGGHTWAALGVSMLEAVAIAGTSPVWLVDYPCAKGTRCGYEVRTSTDGGRTWNATTPLPSGVTPSSAIAFGNAGLLLSGFGAGDIARTADGGRSWTLIAGRCSAQTFESYLASADGTEIWEYCGGDPPLASPPPTPTPETLYVSPDAGVTWSKRTPLGGVTVDAILVSARPGMALLASGAEVAVSIDGGSSWHGVTGALGFSSVSIAASTVALYCVAGAQCWSVEGWAVENTSVIWATHDSGRSWSRLPAQP